LPHNAQLHAVVLKAKELAHHSLYNVAHSKKTGPGPAYLVIVTATFRRVLCSAFPFSAGWSAAAAYPFKTARSSICSSKEDAPVAPLSICWLQPFKQCWWNLQQEYACSDKQKCVAMTMTWTVTDFDGRIIFMGMGPSSLAFTTTIAVLPTRTAVK
jgi:hypothetical protein